MQLDREGNQITTTAIFAGDTFILEYYRKPSENRSETLHRILKEYSGQEAVDYARKKMGMMIEEDATKTTIS